MRLNKPIPPDRDKTNSYALDFVRGGAYFTVRWTKVASAREADDSSSQARQVTEPGFGGKKLKSVNGNMTGKSPY